MRWFVGQARLGPLHSAARAPSELTDSPVNDRIGSRMKGLMQGLW